MNVPNRRRAALPASAARAALAFATLTLLAPAFFAPAAAQGAPSRGKLLYDTHCIACHNSQMHWRDKRVVRDWPGLVTQVRAWQERATLGWSDDDIHEVARHLNDTIYRLPRPVAGAARALAIMPAWPAARGEGPGLTRAEQRPERRPDLLSGRQPASPA